MSAQIVPIIPTLVEYEQVKAEINAKIENLNKYEILTAENEKEAKAAIAELNKVKDRISRYRIDNTNQFLEYINPYINACKELEALCTDGVATVKAKINELETKAKNEKTESIKKLFNFLCEENSFLRKGLIKFEMLFDLKWANKTASLTIIEKELRTKLELICKDIDYITSNCDEPDVIIPIYLEKNFNLSDALQTYQSRFVSSSEIKGMIAAEKQEKIKNTVEKKLDLRITVKQLTKTQAEGLNQFLKNMNVEFNIERI